MRFWLKITRTRHVGEGEHGPIALPGNAGQVRTCVYHSERWKELVEQGWTTTLVDHFPASVGGPVAPIATMWRR